MTQPAVLLVEDTPSLAMLYESVLRRAGREVDVALTGARASEMFAQRRHPVVLLDLMLPDADGLDILRRMRREAPEAKVIAITANGSINRAVQAMRAGAFDFLVKPFDERRLLSALENAVAARAQESAAAEAAATERAARLQFEGFVGSSQPMQTVYDMIRSIARSTATVFVTGESGTGKEVCAQAVHALSQRAEKPFVPLNCAAIPRDLLESEVFGHLRGSFTGAISDQKGAAALADGGTLFMDEICEMGLDLQTKLLRFLQTSMIQPVGAATPRKVDVRIVCATNRDPAEEVRAGRFREDLFYRLHVVPIHLPPLREREDDAVEIAESFLREFSREEGKRFRRMAPATADILRAHPWPGNVRQLQNAVRNVVVLHEGDEVTPDMLPPELIAGLRPRASAPRGPFPGAASFASPAGREAPRAGAWTGGLAPAPSPAMDGEGEEAGLDALIAPLVGLPLADVETALIEATIARCDGSIPRAAHMLGLSPSTIYRKRGSGRVAIPVRGAPVDGG